MMLKSFKKSSSNAAKMTSVYMYSEESLLGDPYCKNSFFNNKIAKAIISHSALPCMVPQVFANITNLPISL